LEAVTRFDPDPELDEPRDGILTPALLALLTRRGIRLRRRERLPDLEVLDAADAALEHEDAYETDRRVFGMSSWVWTERLLEKSFAICWCKRSQEF
jgi:ethanolamine utilization cobalamin adenosyltransferase